MIISVISSSCNDPFYPCIVTFIILIDFVLKYIVSYMSIATPAFL